MPALAEPTVIRTIPADIVPLTTPIQFYGGEKSYYVSVMHGLAKPVYNSSSIKLKSRITLSELSPASKEIVKKLYQFKDLKDNWDGAGAIPPQTEVIENAISFLITMDEIELPAYFVAPGPNGEILLEYKNENHSAEVYFEENNDPEMIIYHNKEQVYTGGVDKLQLAKYFV